MLFDVNLIRDNEMVGTVYRVEHRKSGNGCYSHQPMFLTVQRMIDKHDGESAMSGLHPNPARDIGIEHSPLTDERCGFRSLDQLHNWFTKKELKILFKANFHIVELYGVNITAVGEHQCLFLRVN